MRGACGEIGQRAAGVGEDDLDVWVSSNGAAHDEVDGSSTGFVRVVDDWVGEFGVDETGVGDLGWVDEDDGRAAVELFP